MYGVRHTLLSILSYYVVILVCGAMIMLSPFYLHALMLILASMLSVHILFVASIALSIKYRGSVDPICVCFAFQKHI